jgi:hypothetical protein
VPDDEELFDHQVTALTAGDIRKALEGVPDDFPVRVVTAEEPGSDLAGPEQVVISAGIWNSALEIGCEFPPGRYDRRHR